jgi:hypothetical protein
VRLSRCLAETLLGLLSPVQVNVDLGSDVHGGVAHHHREVLERDAAGVCPRCEGMAQLMKRDLLRES